MSSSIAIFVGYLHEDGQITIFVIEWSGLILNCTGTIYLISQFIFLHKTFHMEFFKKTKPFIKLVKLFHNYGKISLVGLQKKPNTKIQGLQSKLKIKYETEKRISKNNFFEKKWILIPS